VAQVVVLLRRCVQRRKDIVVFRIDFSLVGQQQFRHFFRNAYSFDPDWQKMSPLVLRLEETFQREYSR
jgi:hypothetical protein